MNGKSNGRTPLTGAQLLAGSRSFPMLEIPEITNADGVAQVVYLRGLRTSDVLEFAAAAKAAKAAADRGETIVAENQGIEQMLELIAKSVCDEDGTTLFTADKVS